jgi:hypothetical protein
MDREKEHFKHLLTEKTLEAEEAFALECFGDHLAKKRGYHAHSGLNAIRFYLVEKYHWMPAQVKAMNWEDLSFCMAEEMKDWSLPAAARRAEPEIESVRSAG